MYRAAEIGISWKKKQQRKKSLQAQIENYIPSWNKHLVSRTVNQLRDLLSISTSVQYQQPRRYVGWLNKANSQMTTETILYSS